jgi:CHAT domain-containing protein/tetratricopeptide (TPR) repeat protein
MSEQGDLVKAEEYYRSALEIQEAQMPGSVNVASMLLNMGNLAWERGDLANAESYYQRALAIREKLAPGSLDVAAGLTNLGDVDWERGALRAAEEHYKKALAIQEKQAPGSIDVAMSLNNLGVVAWSRGHLALAQAHYERALAIEQKLAPRGLLSAEILNGLGDVARDRNDLTKAEEYYRRAVAIRENTSPGSTGHAESLAALASIMRRKQHLDEAAQLYDQCLTAIENQTTRLGGGEEVRSSFRAKHARCYRDYIDLLLTRKQPELAFDVLERSRARTLLEMLAGAHVDIRKGVDPLLLQRELSLQRQIDEESDRNSRLPNAEHDEDGTTSKKKLEEFLNQYRQIEGQIRASSPNYAALTGAQPLSVKAVQQQLLDDDTLLLEYALGNDHSFLWAVTPSSLRAYELPGRSKIDSLARRVYDLLTARNLHLTGETELLRQARLAKAEAEYPKAAAALSRIVLGPVAEQLQGKRLLIVSDGALEYIPFAVLPTPLTRGQHPQSPASVSFQPLISQHEIVNLPSASALAVLRHQLIGRKQATKAVAVLADPVFDTYDDRIHIVSRDQGPMDRKSSEPSAPFPSRVNAAIDRSANEPSRPAMRPFPRLPFTRREAEAIYAIAEEGSAIKILDFDASKAMATSAELKDYSIVHFATHGVLDSEHPELSGLVFSLVDRQGKPQNGFVRLLDIYNLDLNADLVVLSACRTALGKQISGEGLVGLTRGFIFAGAARVAASVWNVDDEATAEFMKKFYEGMLKEHQSPAQALRSAQVWMLGQKTWRSPYYWAAFVLQGEWR